MSDRPTPVASNIKRCTAPAIAVEVTLINDIKAGLDAFLLHRHDFERAQMVYLAGILMNKFTQLLSPHLCDIGILLHHESLSDEEYAKLMDDIKQAQEGLTNLEGEETDG